MYENVFQNTYEFIENEFNGQVSKNWINYFDNKIKRFNKKKSKHHHQKEKKDCSLDFN
jgi:hypothetical protein